MKFLLLRLLMILGVRTSRHKAKPYDYTPEEPRLSWLEFGRMQADCAGFQEGKDANAAFNKC